MDELSTSTELFGVKKSPKSHWTEQNRGTKTQPTHWNPQLATHIIKKVTVPTAWGILTSRHLKWSLDAVTFITLQILACWSAHTATSPLECSFKRWFFTDAFQLLRLQPKRKMSILQRMESSLKYTEWWPWWREKINVRLLWRHYHQWFYKFHIIIIMFIYSCDIGLVCFSPLKMSHRNYHHRLLQRDYILSRRILSHCIISKVLLEWCLFSILTLRYQVSYHNDLISACIQSKHSLSSLTTAFSTLYSNLTDMYQSLLHIYSHIFVDFVVKNPLFRYNPDEPFNCPLFTTKLEEYLRTPGPTPRT